MKTNFLKLSALFLSLFILTTSCSKDDDSVTAPTPITYDVKGYYKITSNLGSFVMLIEEGGKFTFVNGANFYSMPSTAIGYGTGYTFTNNVFTGNFKLNLGNGTQYGLTATYDPTTGAFSGGTIGTGTATSGHATWTAQRVINANTDPIGMWYGKYNSTPSNTTTFNSPYTILVEDATHIVVADAGTVSGNSNLAYGTYTASGNTFVGTYKYSFGTGTQYSIAANYNTTEAKFFGGTYGNGSATSGSGNWYLNKLK